MKVKDVELKKIKELLKSVPEGMEIESINLVNGYSLRLIAGTQEINQYNYQQALVELQAVLNSKFSEKGLITRD